MAVFAFVAGGRLMHLEGFGPIHAAACVGNPLILHLLCLNTMHIDLLDEGGWTPACYAAYHDLPDMIEILISYGADMKAGTPTPYVIAHTLGNHSALSKIPPGFQVSSFDRDRTIQPPRDVMHPETFVMAQWVQDPSIYSQTGASSPGYRTMSEKKKKKLDSAIEMLRRRLSTNADSGRNLSSKDIDDSDS
jgi:hypothetical protein